MANPFTEIQTALDGFLAAHFTALPDNNVAKVKLGNRGGLIFRKGQQAADNPAYIARRVELRGAALRTSTSGMFVVAYEVAYRSDERKTTADPTVIDAIEWELIRASAKAADEKLGLAYVTRCAVEGARQTTAATELTAEGQWSGVATLVIEFCKPRSEILPA